MSDWLDGKMEKPEVMALVMMLHSTSPQLRAWNCKPRVSFQLQKVGHSISSTSRY